MTTHNAPSALVGATGTTTFTVAAAHTTVVFGHQQSPPGVPAATDSSPDEAIRLLGTAHLLARVEFTGRESIAGEIPPGTGVVGKTATVAHRGAAPVGTEVVVETEVVGVDGADIRIDGDANTGGRTVGRAEVTLQLVDRERFRDGLEAEPDG